MKLENAAIFLYFAGLAAVFYLSLIPEPPQIVPGFKMVDKLEHLAAYTVLTFLLAFVLSVKMPAARFSLSLSIVLMIAVGALIEWLQSFTGRSPELADLAADAAGAVIGAVAGRRVSLLLQR